MKSLILVFALMAVGCATTSSNEPTKKAWKIDENPSKTPGRTENSIRATIDSSSSAIAQCYKDGVAKNPTMTGRIEYDFKITASGKVDSLKMIRSTLNAPEVEICAFNAMKAITFQPRRYAGVTTVVYSFDFQPHKVAQK